MRGPKPDPVSLSESERSELQRLVRRHSTTQQIALRARIIFEADAGLNTSQIARQLDLAPETVRAWRKRWLVNSRKNAPVANGRGEKSPMKSWREAL